MKCRVGITGDFEDRCKDWESEKEEYPYGFRCWKLKEYASRAEAQKMEDFLRDELDCDGHHGGERPMNPFSPWSMYYIEAPEYSYERVSPELPQRVEAAVREWHRRQASS